jgi:bifunctional non-homologous end joining protein LigD
MDKLQEYRRKRRFDRTPEPSGEPEPSRNRPETPGLPAKAGVSATADKRKPKPNLQLTVRPADEYGDTFVVQKHSATRLHYDFRLAIDGTLKSWAVPKGPSLNSADKRLAVQTEDHPLEYGGFEGKIPEGNYGAGTVMVWDRGTFTVIGDQNASRQIDKGEIKFDLNGEKLKGSFVLVKLKQSEKGNEWLMIKHKDAAEDAQWDLEEHDGSVLTGRTLAEIKEELPPKRAPSPIRASELQGGRKAAMPGKAEPMLATLVEKPFSDPDWLFEIKWDGVRALAWIVDGTLKLRSRNALDVTKQYPELANLPQMLAARNAILDGEIVALDEQGHSNFERLQERMHNRAPSPQLVASTPATYYLFDLLYCDGYDLREAPLVERKELLRRVLHASDRVRFSDHQREHGKELFELVSQKGLEGIIAKRADSLYAGTRSQSWLKLKHTNNLEAVIGGWTEARTPGLPFGSLLLGLYRGKTLQCIGHVGSGFEGKTYKAIAKEMGDRAVDVCPFAAVPDTNEKAHWVSPNLVARVKYGGWTQEQRLRHPVFVGLNAEAQPENCRWESEVEVPVAATVVRAPETAGTVLATKAQIERELFGGKLEKATIVLDGKRVHFTNLNKVYFPESGYTKRDLIAYYYRIAPYLQPFLKDRPLVLRRYPDGIQGQAFFQKDVREGIPEWLSTVAIASDGRGGEEIRYVIANDLASLLFLTNLGCIDHNPWSSRAGDLEHPDYFFFDLDPSDGTDFSTVVAVARALKEKLDELKLKAFLKTSGATGFHIYLPVEPEYSYAELRTFAEIIARFVSAQHPDLVTNERTVAKRPAGRVLIDVHQNATGRPLAAPYVVRAFPHAPVSAPVSPRELRTTLKPERLNIKNILARIEKDGDLWADFWKSRQRIEKAVELLGSDASHRSKK